METISIETWIDAPVERCFLLSLSIDLHVASARSSGEQAIAGVQTGLISEGQTVTFKARHLRRWLQHTSRVDALRPYTYFRDSMVDGVFSRFEHDHHFAPMDEGTRMRDEIRFVAPWGFLGRIATRLLGRRYITELLMERNAGIKQVAESDEWHHYLDGQPMAISLIPEKNKTRKRWKSTVLHPRSQA